MIKFCCMNCGAFTQVNEPSLLCQECSDKGTVAIRRHLADKSMRKTLRENESLANDEMKK